MAHTYTDLLYHVVFSTKNRTPFINNELRTRLWAYMGGIVRELGGTALIVEGTADHVHMLLLLPPTLCISDLMRVVKTNSSRWIHQKWREHREFEWQTGYSAFTVSQSNRNRVVRYISNQQEHHRKMTFKEELVALLERHEIDYDPRPSLFRPSGAERVEIR